MIPGRTQSACVSFHAKIPAECANDFSRFKLILLTLKYVNEPEAVLLLHNPKVALTDILPLFTDTLVAVQLALVLDANTTPILKQLKFCNVRMFTLQTLCLQVLCMGII